MSYPTGPGAPCPRCPGHLVVAIEQSDGVRWRCGASAGENDWHHASATGLLRAGVIELLATAPEGRLALEEAVAAIAATHGVQLAPSNGGHRPPPELRRELEALIDLLVEHELDVVSPLYASLDRALQRQARRQALAVPPPEDLL